MAGTPGGPVHGKTGTAEHGSKNPPETHAWFVGYQGDVAFAVLVEEGKSGGEVAAPVAKDFLTELAATR
jgi:cell division protein FtsI/penicillin-binding protein 2